MSETNYLPFSMVVDANITKNTNFPAKKSFQTLLILAVSANATQREKVFEFSSYKEATDAEATEEITNALSVVFSQAVIPSSVKVAYVDGTADLTAELNRISKIDSNFVFLAVLDEVISSDVAKGKEIAKWGGANRKIVGFVEMNENSLTVLEDSLTKQIGAMSYNRAFSVYADSDDTKYSLLGLMAYLATRDFDKKDSFYTAKFKSFNGVKAVSLTTAQYKGLTGFVTGKGVDKTVGNLGNVFTYIGDRAIFAEGVTASGELISVEHAMLWLEYTIKYEVMNIFTNNDVVPYTNKGIGMIVSAVKLSLDLAKEAGILVDGEYSVSAADALAVPESQRANHIAPPVKWSGRLSGAIHYSSVDGEVNY